MSREAQIVAEAGRLSGLVLGQYAVLRRGDRNLVFRAKVVDSPAEVVIKAALGESHLLAQESAALRRVALVPEAQAYVPRFLAYGLAARIVVTDAVLGARPLDDYLNGTDRGVAAVTLANTARSLGRLHAVTARAAGRDDLTLAKTQGDGFVKLEPAIRELFELGGVTWSKEAGEEFLRIARRLASPGNALAFTVGDMAPSNILVKGSEVVFIDLEYAGYRHAFYDAVFWRCICPFPGRLADEMDEAYRQGWAEMGRPWTSECFVENMTLLAGHRALWSLTWGVKDLWRQDREMVPGVSARKVVRNWLRGFHRLACRSGVLPALAEATERLDHAMGGLWPESAGEVSFPVFDRDPTGGDAK